MRRSLRGRSRFPLGLESHFSDSRLPSGAHEVFVALETEGHFFYTKVHYIPEYMLEVVAGSGCSADLKKVSASTQTKGAIIQ